MIHAVEMRQCNLSNCTAGINEAIGCSCQRHVYVKEVKWMQLYLGQGNHDSLQQWQAGMACLPHNQEHRQEDPMPPIYKGNNADRILTRHEAWMLHKEAEVYCQPATVPSVYGIIAQTAEECRWEWNGNDVRWWMGMQGLYHPCSICCGFSRAMPCCLLSGKLVPMVLGATQRMWLPCVVRSTGPKEDHRDT